MKIGKLSPKDLEELILNPIVENTINRNEVIIRPKNGEDCSAVDFGKEFCIISTDPITGADKNAAYLAVHINCNDIAASGGEPVGILLTALFPPKTTKEEIKEIIKGAYTAANELNVEIIGGHTEITDAVNKPVISGTIIGKTNERNFISSSGAKPGQDIILTKWAGVEGTVILAHDNEKYLLEKINNDTVLEAKNLKFSISVVKDSIIAKNFGATALHDATEGGVLGAIWELAECSGVGVLVYEDKIPVLDITKEICSFYEINPLRLISSGSLVISTFNGENLVSELKQNGINAEIVGKIIDSGMYTISNGNKLCLEEPQSDELYNAKNK